MNKKSLKFPGCSRAAASVLGCLSLFLVALTPVDALAQAGGLVRVEIAGTGEGSIVSDDGNINCPGDCSQTYFENVDIDLTASPGTDSVFVGWQGGGCSGTGVCSVNASQSPFVTAIFDLNTPDTPRSLSVSLVGQGSGGVSSNDQAINCEPDCNASYSNGETVTLTAQAESGSVFQGWQGGGCSGTGTCIVTMSTSRSVSAAFALDTGNQDRTLSVSLAGNGSGAVTSDDQAISCPETCSATYDGTQVVSLVATAANGSVFQGWQGGGCSGTGSCTVTLDQSLTVTASFDHDAGGERQLLVRLAGEGIGVVSSDDQALTCPWPCLATATGSDGDTLVP